MRSIYALTFIIVSCTTLWLAPGRSEAAESLRPMVRLVYQRDVSECPSEQELRAQVSSRLGRDPFDNTAPQDLNVHVFRRETKFRARVALTNAAREPSGERTLDSSGADCAELGVAIAVAISIALEVVAADTATHKPLAPLEHQALEPKPTHEPNATVISPMPSAGSHAQLYVGGGLHGAAGGAPSLSVGGTLLTRLRLPSWSIGIEGRADLPAGTGDRGSGNASASLLGGSLLPCAHTKFFVPCAHGFVGALSGVGEGISAPQRATTVFAAVGGRAAFEWTVGRDWILRAWVDVLGTVTPTTLYVNNVPVWSTPSLSGTLGFGFVARIL